LMKETSPDLIKQIEKWYQCWFRLRGAYQGWADDHGISYNALFVVREIYRTPNGCTQKQICEGIVLSKQTVSSILDKLEKDEIIVRKASEEDRRKKLVCFTEKGQKYADELLSQLAKSDIESYGSVHPKDLQRLIQGGTALADAFDKSFYTLKKSNNKNG